MTKIEQAKQFAHEAHDSIHQVRKYTGEPYWVHTNEVASIILGILNDASIPIQLRIDMICAAHLHDILEDVYPVNRVYGPTEICNTFGKDVLELVVALTDVYTKEAWPQFNRKERKAKERIRIGKTSAAAQTIKLADLISNTKSIVDNDPDFAKVYLREKLELLPFLTEGDSTLLARCSEQIITLGPKVGLTIPMLVCK